MDPNGLGGGERDELLLLLVRHLAAGTVEAEQALPALRELIGRDAPAASVAGLLEALAEHDAPVLRSLRQQLWRRRLDAASAWHERRRSGEAVSIPAGPNLAGLPMPPLGWADEAALPEATRSVLSTFRDWHFIATRRERLPETAAVVHKRLLQELARFRSYRARWAYLWPCLPGVPDGLREEVDAEEARTRRALAEIFTDPAMPQLPSLREDLLIQHIIERYEQPGTDPVERQALVDLALVWPTDAAASLIPRLCRERRSQERAILTLIMRFGMRDRRGWDDWQSWLAGQCEVRRQRENAVRRAADGFQDELLLLWYQGREAPVPSIADELRERVVPRAESIAPQEFHERWQRSLSLVPSEERERLLGAQPAPPSDRGQEEATPSPPPEAAAPEPSPVVLQIWQDHVQPFLAGNWYLIVGLAMVVVGASLVAYFTWDKHWLVRYTIMPSLLATFTVALAGAGGWLEKQDSALRGTAAALRGAAIGLLPLNFVVIALLCKDPNVSHKAVFVPLITVAYLAGFGYALHRWCRAVHNALGLLESPALLLLNTLVALGPATALGSGDADPSLAIAVGFYAGLLAAMVSVWAFLTRVATVALVRERVVPWFFGATLAFTYLGSLAWAHFLAGCVPVATTYAIAVILAGGVVLGAERSLLRLRAEPGHYGGESFLGYALVLLGVLMGMRSPSVRIVSLAAAGIVWLYQASFRRGTLHYWIGLSLVMLGGWAAGLLEGFPKSRELNGLPFLGLALAAGTWFLHRAAAKLERERLSLVARELMVGVLFLAAAASVLSQWHYRSEPLTVGAVLILISVVVGWRAHRMRRLAYVHVAMALLALALPYLGCVDMTGRTLHGNNMVFGLAVLAILWLVFVQARRGPLVLQARSTVLFSLGALAVAGMMIRVIVERGAPTQLPWYRVGMDYGGPFLMVAALTFTAYYSRSLIPAVMAATIGAILFPELKASLQERLPQLGWGTGLGSAISALVIGLVCFPLKRWRLLQALDGGDRLLGESPFPFRRHDHTLFTLPLLGTALFLIAKVDTLNLGRALLSPGGVGGKTTAALALVAITWTLLAVHARGKPLAKVAVHFGWVSAFLFFYFLNDLCADSPRLQTPIVLTGVLLQVMFLIYRILERRHPWVRDLLRLPTQVTLRRGSLLLAYGMVLALALGYDPDRANWLCAFLIAQLAWHGLSTRERVHGAVLFALLFIVLLAWFTPGRGMLLHRILVRQPLSPVLWLALSVHIIQIALEWRRNWYQRLDPIAHPFQVGAALVASVACVVAFMDVVPSHTIMITRPQQILLLCVVALTARAQVSAAFALAGIALGFLFVQIGELQVLSAPAERLLLMATPWRLAAFALAIAASVRAGQFAQARWPRLLASPFAPDSSLGRSPLILSVPSVLLACIASLFQTVHAPWRHEATQLWAPYLGSVTLGLIAWSWRGLAIGAAPVAALAGLLLCLGNVHAVRLTVGDALLSRGLSYAHLISLGLVFTLLQGTAARVVVRREQATRRLNQASLCLAAAVLALLALNYFVHPDLSTISWPRFIVSGLMAYAGGLYFRWAARHPGLGEEELVEWYEGAYHFGLCMAMWCAVLLIPCLRYPSTAFLALGVPPLYFYVRAEYGLQSRSPLTREVARRYRNSAVVLAFALVALYASKGIFHAILFPGIRIQMAHYHHNAGTVAALGLLLFRLHALGGTWWLAFYGGLALVTGSYFALTSFPGLSPFHEPIAAAWAGVGLTHFFIVASSQQSPLRTVLQRIGRIDAATWTSLRIPWGRCLLVASQIVVLLGLADCAKDTHQFAPLLLGAASILIHQGILARSGSYFLVAAVQLAVALHTDFVLPSYLPKDYVVWVVLTLWLGMVMGFRHLEEWLPAKIIPGAVIAFLICGLGHVFYHHPCSTQALWAVAVMGVLGALTPCGSRSPTTVGQKLAATLLLLPVPWLAYFSQSRLPESGLDALLDAWPILAASLAILATGATARLFKRRWAALFETVSVVQPRLYHQTLSFLGRFGDLVNTCCLWVCFALSVLAMLLHYQEPFSPGALGLFAVLWAGQAWAWHVEGRERGAILSHVIAELCVFGLFALVRRQLILTTTLWTPEYDVWASLAVSACLTGARGAIERQPREARLSLTGTIVALPVAAMAWTLARGLGTDITLVVLGLHSVMFTYLGRAERESPYNFVAVGGFVAFTAVLFWSKLELRVLHAYVIPVGIGLLVLLQLFGREIKAELRNGIRTTIVLCMVGCTAYYALADDRYPLAFNVTFLLLSLAAMGLGSLLQVRIYLLLGSTSALVSLATIFYKVVARLDATYRMTAVGSLLLLLGVGLVAGSVYCKTNRDKVESWLHRVRERLGAWE